MQIMVPDPTTGSLKLVKRRLPKAELDNLSGDLGSHMKPDLPDVEGDFEDLSLWEQLDMGVRMMRDD